MPRLSLIGVSIRYDGQTAPAVERANLEVRTGDFVVLTGRSGCGKTSLLSAAAGLVSPSSGRIELDGRAVDKPDAGRAVVYQNDALFPWLSVRDNVSFALRMRGLPKAERDSRSDELLAKVRLPDSGSKAIWELSGGMRQRVGLARALAAEPEFLLMDEPLGALDALTRERMQTLLLDIWAGNPLGVLMVTHGIEEALLLATKIIVVAPDPGRIVRSFDVDFSRRYVAGEPVKLIKARPDFIAARADLSDAIFEGEAA